MKFEGELITVTPFFQTIPDGDKNRTNCMSVFNSTTNRVTRVPIISPNTLRATLRHGIAMDILEKIGDGKLDYLTLGFLVVGGTLDPTKKEDKNSYVNISTFLETIKKIKERNIVARLFGGSAGTFMIEGKIIVSPGILICEDTQEITGMDSNIPAREYMEIGMSSVRRDPMMDDINVFTKLSWAGVEELEKRAMQHKLVSEQRKKERKERKNRSKNTEETEDKLSLLPEEESVATAVEDIDSAEDSNDIKSKDTTLRNKMEMKQYVIPGARFYHMIEIPFATDIEIGAIYSALKTFSNRPRLGNMKSKIGEFRVDYRVYDDEGNEVDRIKINGSEPSVEKRFICSNETFLNAYIEYLKNITVEDIFIPRLLDTKKEKGNGK